MRAAQGGLTNNNLPLGASPPHKPDSPSIQPRRHVKPSQAGWPGQGKGQGRARGRANSPLAPYGGTGSPAASDIR